MIDSNLNSLTVGPDKEDDSPQKADKRKRHRRSKKPKAQTAELGSEKETLCDAEVVEPIKTSDNEVTAPKRRKNRRKKGSGAGLASVGSAEEKTEVVADDSKPKKRNRAKKNKNKEKVNITGKHIPVSSLFERPENNNMFGNASLSAEGLALLEDIQNHRSGKTKLRTGKIEMSELMGTNRSSSRSVRSILEQLSGTKVDPEVLLGSSRVPLLAGFPSLAHRGDSFSSALPADLFKSTMDAYASLHGDMHSLGSRPISRSSVRSNPRSYGNEAVSPNHIMPWINFAPMYPLDNRQHKGEHRSPGYQRPQGMGGHSVNAGGSGSNRSNHGPSHNNQRGSYHNSYPNRMNSNNSSPHHNRSSPGRFQQTPNKPGNHNQRIRKSHFTPYLSGELVSRGLVKKELIKGALRVNQRNYEESYIDNPDGDDQMDLLILGLQDRNRALHGDIVVVKIKPRQFWVVRENLYQAWRSGQLDVSRDDNGLPLTIPPVQEDDTTDSVDLVLGGISDLKLSKSDLKASIPVSPENKYNREEMVLIGAQLEHARRESPVAEQNPLCKPQPVVQEMITNLSIGRVADVPLSSSPRKPASSRKPANSVNRRTQCRMLQDMPPEDWGMPDFCLQKTAEVVFISEVKNSRNAMGQLRVMADNNRNCALFSPTDPRIPRMMIPAAQLPQDFFERPQDYSKYIFAVKLEKWEETDLFATGHLLRTLGVAGDIEAETEGLLYQKNIDAREFSSAALSSLPITEASQWTIPEKEFTYRKDLREEIIFTIDPLTARDLDDALHIKPKENIDGKGKNGWEIGVHIADVTHFLIENSELDHWATQRATSTYLVHKVIPMLPRILCEQLCSLNSSVDRLAFSVIWDVDDEGIIHSEWFGRSIIRSKVKLSYEHAQQFIENPEEKFETSQFPDICDNVELDVIKTKVLQLNAVASKLRATRIANGALRLDQPKLKFALDEDRKYPIGVTVYEIKDSNRLVEEFMLMANMSVAKKIEGAFPQVALLRNHPSPNRKVMKEVLELCEKIGFPLDGSSSGLLSSSLRKFEGDQELVKNINQVLSMLMMKSMRLAQYFCTGTRDSKESYHHYALNAPFYTHFTSPIRRYADVMVHRLLAAALNYSAPPEKSIQEVEKIARICNEKKQDARDCSEASDEMFFANFVKECGPIEERGVVVNVLDQAFDVLVLKYGVVKRVYVNKLDMARDPVHREGPPPTLTLYWNSSSGSGNAAVEQTIQLCSIVDVVLSALPEPTKLS
ncbi:unnamed protein product [Auanema sp. JU1783]|nr:unnamed protein product [Auanema sp. JU1783]